MNNPRLLSGHTMTEKAQLHPLAHGLTLNAEPLSTATMTLCSGDPEVKVNDWVRLYRPNGKDCGVFRIKSIKTNYTSDGLREISLEHCFATFKDTLIDGEVKPKNMGGSDTSVSIQNALRYLIGRQKTPHWTLGRCDFDVSEGWTFKRQNIMNCLTTLTNSIADYEWNFDMSALPWKLNLVRREQNPTREMRLARNVATMSTTVDMSDMYTRLYPIGYEDLTIESVNGGKRYVEKNTSVYGVIEATDTDQAIESASVLMRRAQMLLDKYSEPLVTVQISGFDLSAQTGWDIDDIDIGHVCRVPLPEYGTTITDRVTTVSWANIIADPYTINVTLANPRPKLTDVLLREMEKQEKTAKAGGGSGKRATETTKDLWTRLEKTDERILLEAGRIDGAERNIAAIQVTADSITSAVAKYKVGDFGELIDSQYSKITQTSDAITSEVNRAKKAESAMKSEILSESSRITQTANSIVLEVNRATKAEGELRSSIDLKADSIDINTKIANINTNITNINGEIANINVDLAAITGALTVGAQIEAKKAIYSTTALISGGYITAVTDITANRDLIGNGLKIADIRYSGKEITYATGIGKASTDQFLATSRIEN